MKQASHNGRQVKALVTLYVALGCAACGGSKVDVTLASPTQLRGIQRVVDVTLFIAVMEGIQLRSPPKAITWQIASDTQAFIKDCKCYAHTVFTGAQIEVTLSMIDGVTRESTESIEATSAIHEILHILSIKADHDADHSEFKVWHQLFYTTFNAVNQTAYGE